jgi:2-polyprenyl-3-methyl-5-hydroxy-6-metoxy-1,4-benzoquinol methylase
VQEVSEAKGSAGASASTACELCGYAGEMQPFYPAKGIMRCPKCDLVFYDGKVDPRALYTKDYFTGEEYHNYLADKPIIQRNFRARIKDLLKRKPSGRLLELGCAYGFFLELAKDHWDAVGMDIAEDATEYARSKLGVNAITADFLSVPDQPETYDIICMWDTIEHLPRPVRFVEKAARWLKPGGILVMTTGDIGSKMARKRGENWRQIHPPTHTFYFSADTLGKASRQAGLEVVDVQHVGYSRSYASMVHGVLGLKQRKTSFLYNVFTLGGVLDFPIYLNLYDIVMVTARKP